MDGACTVVVVSIYSKERHGGYSVQWIEVIILNSSYRIHTCVANEFLLFIHTHDTHIPLPHSFLLKYLQL